MNFRITRRRFGLVFLILVFLGLPLLVLLPISRPDRGRHGAISWLQSIALLRTQTEAESEGGGRGKVSWFYEQRAYPLTTIPRNARNSALRDLDQEEARLRTLPTRFTNATLKVAAEVAWAPIGPAPIRNAQTFGFPRVEVSGRISAMALDPRYNGTSNRTVYIGAAQGGVWRSLDNGAHWEPLTDELPSLAIGAITIDPTNPDVIYVGTGEGNRAADTYYGAGLFKSTDGGQTWTQITGPVSTTPPGLPSFLNASFMRIEVDPSSPSTLYAATNVGLTGGASGGSGVAPIGNRGIWKSTDSGANWRNLSPANDGVDRSATDILLDPRNPRRVYAAILNLGIYRSESGGEPGSWQRLTGGLPAVPDPDNSPFRRVLMAMGPPLPPSNQTTLYAAFGAANEDLLGIWRSTDNGENWVKITGDNRPQNAGQANYNLALAVDPTDANIVYYGTSTNTINSGGTLWRTTNGGTTWTDLSRGNGTGGLHADTHVIVVTPVNRDVVFTGNDGGVWRSDNATSNDVGWWSLNETLNLTQFQSIALHPTNPNIVIGGTQDNGTNRYDGDARWTHIRGGDGGFTLIDQSNPSTMYHTFFNQSNSDGRAQMGPEISFNGGASWSRRGCFSCNAVAGNINPADRVGFYAPMAQHPAFTGESGNVIYFGTHRLYRSSDQGITWRGLGGSTDDFGADLTRGGDGRLSAIAAHPRLETTTPTPGETVWVGTSDGLIQVTTSGGALNAATFTDVTKAPLPNRFVTDIAPDPRDSRRAIVTYSGFNISTPTTPGHVFLTVDRGNNWTDISGNLPDVPVTSVAMDPSSNRIFIGTDIGVFLSADGGATWARLGNGMPRVATYMVRYQAATNTVFAATHGRGIFRLTMTGSLATVSAASFAATSIAPESLVASFGTGLSVASASAAAIPLPFALDGTRVTVSDSGGVDRAAPLLFVSPSQVNFQVPPGTAAGPATITVTSSTGTVAQGTVQVSAVAPALFTANADGKGAAAGNAIRIDSSNAQISSPLAVLDGTNKFVTNPIDLGSTADRTFLVLFGSGLRFRSALSGTTVKIGDVSTGVEYAGPQLTFVGVDQVNVVIPRTLAGQGEVDVLLTVDGKEANIVRVKFK